MDSFGYRNWGSTGSYLEDSESPEASPDHTAPNRRTSGNSRYSQSKATNDDYDFEISDSNDYEVSPEPAKQKNSYSSSLRGDSSTRYGSTRRTSVADRAKEILERNKSAKQVADDDDGPSTFQSTYAELLEGLEFNKTDDTPDESMLDIVSPKSDVRATRQKSFLGSPGLDSSSYGDSFEISAADFEVGHLAARRAKEKASERGRRMALDKAPQAKVSASPDVHKKQRGGQNEGFQMSAALSSIHRSGNAESGIKGFSSTERSDDELYRMLNISGSENPMNVSRKSGSFGTNLGRRSNIEEPLSRPAPLRSARSESQLSDVTQGSDEMESPEKNDRFDMDAVKLKMKSHLVDNQNKTNSASFDEDILDGGDDEYEDDISANSEMAHTPNISQSVEDMKKFSEDVKKFAERSVTQPSSYLKPASSLSNDYSLEGYESLYRDESDGVLKRPFLAMKETTAPDHKTIGSTTPSDRSYASENNKRADASSPCSYTSNSAKPVTKETTSTGMNSVEEIMQRWYNIDSDFLTVDTTEEFLDKNTKVDSKAEIASVQLVGTEKPPLVPIAAPFRSLAVELPQESNKTISRSGSPSPSPSSSGLQASVSPQSMVLSTQGVKSVASAGETPRSEVSERATEDDALSIAGDSLAKSGDSGFGFHQSASDALAGLNIIDAVGSANMITSIPPSEPSMLSPNTNASAKNNKDNPFMKTTSVSSLDSYHNANSVNQVPLPFSNVEKPSISPRLGSFAGIQEMKQDTNNLNNPNSNQNLDGGKFSSNAERTNSSTPTSAAQRYQQEESFEDESEIHVNAVPNNITSEVNIHAKNNTNSNFDKADSTSNTNKGRNPFQHGSIDDLIAFTSQMETISSHKQEKSISPDIMDKLSSNDGLEDIPSYIGSQFRISSSSKELHKHLQLTEASSARRMAAATAAKLKSKKTQAKSKLPQKRIVSQSVRQGITIRKSDHQQEEDVQREKILKLSNDNARLSKKFTELEKEVKRMRLATGSSAATNSDHIDQKADRASFNDSNIHDSEIVEKFAKDNLRLLRKYESLEKELKELKESQQVSQTTAQISGNLGKLKEKITTKRAAKNESIASPKSFTRDKKESVLENELGMLAEQQNYITTKERDIRGKDFELRLRESLLEAKEKSLMDSQQERLQRSIATFSYTPSALPEASIDIENDLKTVTENRENELLEEIERLKSQLFTIQQNKDVEDHAPPENYPNTDKLASKLPKEEASDKYPDRWSSSIPSHKYGHYPYAAIREKIHGDKKESLNDPEMISLEKSEYDNLLKEYKAQEVLITGFQKENERLAKLLKEHEDEDSARRAAFFDQQEEMNRELNKLRNAYRRDFVQHSGRMSADLLRVDLEKDATIRSLQGRLREAEAQMGDRESDLRKELEKFKRENRELVGALAVAQQHRSLYAEDHKAHHDGKLQGAIQEIRRLSEKLRWFNDNQRVIDTIESEKESIIKVFNTLIAAVLRSGVEENDLKQIVGKALHEHGLSHLQLWRPDLAAEEYSAQKDLSRITHKQTRSAADVKKIRELENTIKELQESLLKRNPNSVASLIRAASMSDGEKVKITELESTIERLTAELASVHESADKKIRSLRQEYEKLRFQYDNKLPTTTEVSTPTNTKDRSGFYSESQVVDDIPLAQAHEKIRSLEIEAERIRHFYSKKIEETQKKHEAQIKAMKRGDVAVSHLNSPAPKSEMDLASIDQIKSFYSERLALLENELMKTSEELGRWKAANSKLVENYNVLTEKAGRIDLVDQQRTPTEMQASMERLKIDYERQLQDLRETHMRELESVRKELRLERSVLEEKLGNEMAKTTELRNALHDTRENTSKQLPPTPQMVHLQNMEHQIQMLESRLNRRDSEMKSAVEEVKLSAKMERSRLQSIHDQEMREKDEQLVRFQSELEQLVQAMKIWQHGIVPVSSMSV